MVEAPKIEKLESKEIDIVEYIGKLGKIFSTVLKSSKWSDKVIDDNRKEFVEIERVVKDAMGKVIKKKGKKCTKSDCECEDCNGKRKRWSAKKFFLTITRTEASKKDVMNYYLNNPKMNICKVAVAQEVHKTIKDGIEKHLHVYLEFCAKKDVKNYTFFNLPEEFSIYGNISADIDTIRKRTKENIYGYMLKSDKNCYSYGFNIRQDAYGKLKAKEIWYKVAIGEWNIGDVVKYDPSYMLKDLKKIQERIWDNETYLEKRFKMDFVW